MAVILSRRSWVHRGAPSEILPREARSLRTARRWLPAPLAGRFLPDAREAVGRARFRDSYTRIAPRAGRLTIFVMSHATVTHAGCARARLDYSAVGVKRTLSSMSRKVRTPRPRSLLPDQPPRRRSVTVPVSWPRWPWGT